MRDPSLEEPTVTVWPNGPSVRPANAASRWTWVAAGATALAAVGFWLAWGERRGGDSLEVAVKPLVDAMRGRRLTEARLVGGFAHAPWSGAGRGAPPGPDVDGEIALAAARIRDAAERDPTTSRTHAWASARLLLGGKDEAVAAMEDLTQRVGGAAAWSDLAAAYLESSEDAIDAARAVDAAARALAADPSLPEARFNHALALERLSLHASAVAGWQAVIGREPADGWRHEGQSHREALAARAAPDPGRFEETLHAAMLARDRAAVAALVATNVSWSWDIWESKYVGRSAEDGRDQEGLRILGEEIGARARDGSLAPGVPTRSAAARTYARARALYDRAEWKTAAQEFARVAAPAHGGLHGWTELYRGILALQEARAAEARATLGGVVALAERNGWCMLAGRSLWARGVVEGSQGRLDSALSDYERAAMYFERVGALEHAGYVAHLRSEVLDLLGDHRGAWEERARALAGHLAFRDARRRFGIFLVGANSARDAGLDHLSAELLDAVSADVEAHGAVTDQLQFLLRKAAGTATDRRIPAHEHLPRARELLDTITDPVTRARFEQELLLAEAVHLPQGEPRRAARDQAILMLKARHAEARLPDLLFSRAADHGQRGSWEKAGEDIDLALEIYRRSAALEAQRRQAYWRLGEIRLPELIDAGLAAPGPGLAPLLQVERARALWYDEQAVSLPRIEGDFRRVAQELGPDEAGLVYYDGDDRRGVIVVRAGGFDLVPLPGSARRLRWLRDAAAEAARSRRSELLLAHLGGLYDLLLAPIEPLLSGRERLAVVPSSETMGLPFGALWNARTRRFLVQDAEVQLFPSLSSLSRPAHPQHRDGRLLFIGGSRGEGEAPLPAVATERRRLEQVYGSRFVSARAASKEELLAALGTASTVHFAGHVRSGRRYPGLSWFQPSMGGRAATVFAHELQGARTEPGALVVVNGCRSAGDAETSGGGIGFVRPFLLAGAGAVAASSWDVFDEEAASAMAELHERYQAGASPSAALCALQRERVQRGEPVWAWGGYGVFLRARERDAARRGSDGGKIQP